MTRNLKTGFPKNTMCNRFWTFRRFHTTNRYIIGTPRPPFGVYPPHLWTPFGRVCNTFKSLIPPVGPSNGFVGRYKWFIMTPKWTPFRTSYPQDPRVPTPNPEVGTPLRSCRTPLDTPFWRVREHLVHHRNPMRSP